MYNFFNFIENLKPEEILVYLRKSRADDPALTVEEILEKHEIRIDEWTEQTFGSKVPQSNRFYEIVSGEKISERPEFNKVLRLIENPQYKAILCFDTARISRGDLEDAGRLIKLLRYTSTYVITVSPFEFYDLGVERDRDLFERALKRGNEYLEYFKKVSSNGKYVSCSQGNYIASAPPYGYQKTKVLVGKKECPTLVVDEEQAKIVRLIYDMYVNKNMGCTRIANYLNNLKIKPPKSDYWLPDCVAQTLENIHYIGKVKWNHKKTINVVEDGRIVKRRPRAKQGEYEIFDGKHEAIISEELFYAAQAKKGTLHRAKPDTKVRNPFAGILQCSCGKTMVFRCNPSPARLYCRYLSRCGNASIQFTEMFDKICEILEQKIEDFELEMKSEDGDAIRVHERLIVSLEKKLKELDDRELAQWEQQSHPDPAQRMPTAIFKQLNERLIKEREEVKQALVEAKASAPKPVNYEDKIRRFSDALEAMRDPKADPELQNILLKACFNKIIYSRTKPEKVLALDIVFND